MDIHDLPGAVQALERGEVMSTDNLIFVLVFAILLFCLLADCLRASIEEEKQERRNRIWKTTRGSSAK